MNKMTSHPDLLELELCRTGEASDWVTRHVEDCAECRQHLSFLGDVRVGMHFEEAQSTLAESLDVAIRADIAARVQEIRAPRSFRLPRWAMAVAAALVVGCLVLLSQQEFKRSDDSVVFLREDVNRDGRVDIIDAYVLAVAINDGASAGSEWDFNADGEADVADVRSVAMKAVEVGE